MKHSVLVALLILGCVPARPYGVLPKDLRVGDCVLILGLIHKTSRVGRFSVDLMRKPAPNLAEYVLVISKDDSVALARADCE